MLKKWAKFGQLGDGAVPNLRVTVSSLTSAYPELAGLYNVVAQLQSDQTRSGLKGACGRDGKSAVVPWFGTVCTLAAAA